MTASLFVWAFGLSVAYSLLPGAVMIETLRRGTMGGFRAAVRVRVGALLGSLAWAGLALSGAGMVLRQPSVQLVIGALGTALLLRMAWCGLVTARMTTGTPPPAAIGKGDVLCGVGFALMNPLGGVFWMAMTGKIAQAAPTVGWPAGVAVFLSGYILGHLLYTLVFAAGITRGQRLAGPVLLHWTNRVGGATLAIFGLQLLVRTIHLA